MTEVIMRKRVAHAGEVGLFPVDEESYDTLARIKHNRDVGCSVVQRRNPRHHRLFFAVLKFVQMHSPVMFGVPVDYLKTAVKLATGLCDTFIDQRTGEVYRVPRSIAFAAMDQTEFAPWFDEACRVIAQRWMPAGTTPASVRDELIRMVDGPHALIGHE
jgi:hypothetical protein